MSRAQERTSIASTSGCCPFSPYPLHERRSGDAGLRAHRQKARGAGTASRDVPVSHARATQVILGQRYELVALLRRQDCRLRRMTISMTGLCAGVASDTYSCLRPSAQAEATAMERLRERIEREARRCTPDRSEVTQRCEASRGARLRQAAPAQVHALARVRARLRTSHAGEGGGGGLPRGHCRVAHSELASLQRLHRAARRRAHDALCRRSPRRVACSRRGVAPHRVVAEERRRADTLRRWRNCRENGWVTEEVKTAGEPKLTLGLR